MRLFEQSYRKVIEAAQHRHAPYMLGSISFLESFILPFPPPDVMLAPMSLAQPKKAIWFASLTMIMSVIGGVVGYLLGAFAFDYIAPYIEQWGYQSRFDKVVEWFEVWGFWAILVAGFSPVPYKIFTISAGLLSLSFVPFVVASVVGRGARFFLVAILLAKLGPTIEQRLIRYIEQIGWATVILLCIVIGYFSVF